ncbi:MAG: zinc ribbon domain-containing protein [Mesorhizobium sp.]|uniref:zinc ribbon domain-containing protein n=1 Tax=Mesorhizobium sp. TaxID=1871066 RepID=UPI0012205714|nr:zinc ribbon domain-containing protein [Mesorhizobium sp.]TIL91461.1 MAG: zinc ribbon domain-containing protein [Mesorhizobium sp.]
MLIAVYLGLAFIVGIAAQNYRGRRGTPWFLLSLIISPILAGLLLLASKDNRQASVVVATISEERETNGPIFEKTCPECAEQVKVDAKICRFCRHEFT